MRRLSVTEYLIAENQRQSTVTTYARLGDAINEAMQQYGTPGSAPIIECLDMVQARVLLGGNDIYQMDTYHLRTISSPAFAYVHAWAVIGGNPVFTIEQAKE